MIAEWGRKRKQLSIFRRGVMKSSGNRHCLPRGIERKIKVAFKLLRAYKQ